MSTSAPIIVQKKEALGYAFASGQFFDDGLSTSYNVSSNSNYLQYNGIGRVGVRFDAGASEIGTSIKSVLVRFRKYGSPTGPITIGVRKASDDSLVSIGTWPIESFPAGVEQSLVVRLKSNTYSTVLNDLVSVEYPSNATNGFEIAVNTGQANPPNHTGRSHNGTIWANTTNPPAITIKG